MCTTFLSEDGAIMLDNEQRQKIGGAYLSMAATGERVLGMPIKYLENSSS
jgi:hypothetical protein